MEVYDRGRDGMEGAERERERGRCKGGHRVRQCREAVEEVEKGDRSSGEAEKKVRGSGERDNRKRTEQTQMGKGMERYWGDLKEEPRDNHHWKGSGS